MRLSIASSWCGFAMIAAPRRTCTGAPVRGLSKSEIIRCVKRYVAREV